MRTKWFFLEVIAVAILLILLIAYSIFRYTDTEVTAVVSDFESCVGAGYPVLEIYPEQCRTPDGDVFVRSITAPTDSQNFAMVAPVFYSYFDTDILLNTGEEALFADTLRIMLREINDSRCKEGVQCVWEGELSAVFEIDGGLYGRETVELQLGTKQNTTSSRNDYTIMLVAAETANVTIQVTRDTVAPVDTPTTQRGGFATGHVTIGPVCPVERIDSPCVIPPETYTSRSIVVYANDGITKVEKTRLDADGSFSVALQAGNYWLQVQPAGIGLGEKKLVSILPNEATTVDFDIDTGIR